MNFDNQGWLDVAQEYNISNNSWDRGGIIASHLVVHGTAGGTNGGDTMAYMGNNGVSTHFAISVDGTIYQGIPCSRAAWANAPLKSPTLNFVQANLNPNLWTISIEFCKPDITNQVNITDAQKASGFALIAAICDQYHIPKRRGDGAGGVIRHADINSIDRARCPGTFPFDDLWKYLQQGDANVLDISQASQYFIETVKDQRWHCKSTGFDVAGAILNYYRTCTQVGLNGLSQYGLPVGPELALTTVKGAVFQRFERGIVVYDPQHADDSVPGIAGPCYPGHLDRYALPTPGRVSAVVGDLQTIQAAISNAISVLKG